MRDVSVILPWPPSVNNYWRKNKTGMYITKEGKIFRNKVLFLCLNFKRYFVNDERLKVTINVFPPDRRRRDIDNLLKSTLDALEKAKVFEDDSQIDEIHVIRQKQLNSEIHVNISSLSP